MCVLFSFRSFGYNDMRIAKTTTRLEENKAAVRKLIASTYRGAEAVKSNYEGIFSAVGLDLQFAIDENVLDGDYGFVCSTSDGAATILADESSAPEVNRELWVVHKADGQWKIAFYMYNKMS